MNSLYARNYDITIELGWFLNDIYLCDMKYDIINKSKYNKVWFNQNENEFRLYLQSDI